VAHAPAGMVTQRARCASESDRKSTRQWVSLSLSQVWAMVALSSVFIMLCLWLVRPHDFWSHIRAGQWMLETTSIPTTDLFSFTRAGQPWLNQSWLMEIGLYLLYQAGGMALVIFVHAVVVTVAYGLVLKATRLSALGDLRWASVATFAAAAVSVANWNVRPQTISFPLFGITLLAVMSERQQQGQRRNWVWLLVPLYVLWANAHGGFVFGLALLGASVLGELYDWKRFGRRFPTRLVLLTALCAVATLISPLGLGMVDYVLGFVRHPVTQSLNMEFLPPTVRTLDGQLFFAFLALLIGSMLMSGRRPKAAESVGLLLFGVLALMSRRNTAWFGIASAPTVAASLQAWHSKARPRSPSSAGQQKANLAIAVLLSLMALLSLPWFRPYLPMPAWRQAYVSPETPVQAVAWLKDQGNPARMFHEVGYGSYLIWAAPEYPVFVDTRVELYDEAIWMDYVQVSQARHGWEQTLSAYGVDTLMLSHELQSPLIEAAQDSRSWKTVYSDEETAILAQVVR